MDVASRVRVEGPLAPLAGRFRAELRSVGYGADWSAVQLRLLAGLSRWLSGRGLTVGDLTTARVGEFFAVRRARSKVSRVPPTVTGPLVSFLRGEGLFDTPTGPPGDAVDELVARFRRHLVVERGLRESTIGLYEEAARTFVRAIGTGADLGALEAEQVTRFVLADARQRSVASATNMIVGLRSFLRYAFVECLVARRLDAAVPTVANWRASALPRALEPGIPERLVGACDRRTTIGRRDYAVLHCLWRLGLRVGEVTALGLDELDWRAGEIVVHGKGGREERLPLPVDVGEAIVGYLRRGRPRSPSRALFLRARPPFGPLSPTAVRWAVYRSCDALGIARFGAHRLRHTTAAELLAKNYYFEFGNQEIITLIEISDFTPPDQSVFVPSLWPGERVDPESPDKVDHIAFNVLTRADLEWYREHLSDHGVTVSNVFEPSDIKFVTSIYFFDPSGNPLEIATFDLTGSFWEGRGPEERDQWLDPEPVPELFS